MITVYLVYYLLVYILYRDYLGDHCTVYWVYYLLVYIVTIQGDHCIFGILFTSIYRDYLR